jgi:hypothetical protein
MAALMATLCFGLCVLLISVAGWLWPSKDFPKTMPATSVMTGVTQTEFNVKELCQHLKTMPETELLRFGQVVKYMCSLEANCEPPNGNGSLCSLGKQEWNGADGTQSCRWTNRSNFLPSWQECKSPRLKFS